MNGHIERSLRRVTEQFLKEHISSVEGRLSSVPLLQHNMGHYTRKPS